jgi:hypothetical protein
MQARIAVLKSRHGNVIDIAELESILEYMTYAPDCPWWEQTSYARQVEDRETIPWLLDAVQQPDGTYLCDVDLQTFESFFD